MRELNKRSERSTFAEMSALSSALRSGPVRFFAQKGVQPRPGPVLNLSYIKKTGPNRVGPVLLGSVAALNRLNNRFFKGPVDNWFQPVITQLQPVFIKFIIY